jgi:hypothetical protein
LRRLFGRAGSPAKSIDADVSADGQKFLIPTSPTKAAFIVVSNWQAAFKKSVEERVYPAAARTPFACSRWET